MAANTPFRPSVGTTKTLAATAVSASVTFDAKDAGTVAGKSVIRVYNAGTGLAFGRWGTGAQTALATDMPLVPGVVEVFCKANTDDTFAAICPGGTSTIYVSCGEGM